MNLLENLDVHTLKMLQGLNDDQREIAAKVISESINQGVNPNFALHLVNSESKFNPNAKSSTGAFGVMQLDPDTATGLHVDLSDVDQNISGGIRLIKELSSNKKIGDDPVKVLAGYNTSTATRNKFLDSGDLNDLPKETLQYISNVGNSAGGSLPNVNFSSEEHHVENQPQQYPQPVIQDASPQIGDQSPEDTNLLYGGAGYLAGAGVGATKVGVVKGAKKAIDWFNNKDQENNSRIEPTIEQTPTALAVKAQQPQSTQTHGGENWVESLTGVKLPNAQMKKGSLDLAKGMQDAIGINGVPGFTGGQITEGGVITSPQDAAAIQRKNLLNQTSSDRISGVNNRLNDVLQRNASNPQQPNSFTDNISAIFKYGSPEQKDLLSRARQRVKSASNVTNLGSAGMGLGMAVPSAIAEYQKGEEGHPWWTLGAGTGFGAASALFPKAAPIVGTGLSALDTANRALNKDYTGAALSSIGTVGPLAALSLLQPEIGIPVAVASQFFPAAINTYRDYVNWQQNKQNKQSAGGGRGFVNPSLAIPDSD